MKKILFLAIAALFLTSCQGHKNYQETPALVSIHLVDRDGQSEAISMKDRLEIYEKTNFYEPQPFQKVLRVYSRDEKGDIHAYITTYHSNGHIKQYLEIVNNRAFGVYQEWFPNGRMKVDAFVIEGAADISLAAEKSWIFEGEAKAFDESGHLIAKIPYVHGTQNGLALYYHDDGSLWKEIPYTSGLIDGPLKMYTECGTLLQITPYCHGLKNGKSERFWDENSLAASEIFDNGNLITASYYSKEGILVAQIIDGKGYKAIFSKNGISELQEHYLGIPEGLVQVFNSSSQKIREYHVKNGLKTGEEILFYYSKEKNEMTPKLSVMWYQGKIQGVTKSWYEKGQMESQKEFSNNIKNGLSTVWYMDGPLMMIEHYEEGKLIKGDYFKKGEKEPLSQVISGEGTVTLFDPKGAPLRKIKYSSGVPNND